MRPLLTLLLGIFWIVLVSCSLDKPVSSLRSSSQDEDWIVTSTIPIEFSSKIHINKNHDRVRRHHTSPSSLKSSDLHIYRVAKGNFTIQALRKEILSSKLAGNSVTIEQNIRFFVAGSSGSSGKKTKVLFYSFLVIS